MLFQFSRRKKGTDTQGFLYDDFPSQRHPLPMQFSIPGSVAWIPKFMIDIVADKIEK
jgi:hypothetical protein